MTDLSTLINAVPARIRTDLAIATRAIEALDPSVLEETPPYIWPMEISSDRIDAYCTRMDPATTLRNYAAEATSGVAFLAGHNSRTLPFGYTLSGRYEATVESGAQARVIAEAYTLPGLDIGGVKTDDFIRGVRAGIVRDVSIGFYGGQWICSICGRDMMADWECYHWPGHLYEVEQPGAPGQPGSTMEVRCTALVVDAHLSEVSAVYDGATPGAMILRAQQAAELGRLNDRQRRLLETQYRIHLPDTRLLVSGADTPRAAPPALEDSRRAASATPQPQEEPMPPTPEERGAPAPIALASLDSIRQIFGLAGDVDPLDYCRTLAADLTRLRAQADDGAAYRNDLIADALAEGVRALGGAFAEETYRGLLEAAPLTVIKRMRDDWQATARVRLPGGRLSNDQGDPPAAPPAKQDPPADVYRA